KLGWPNYLGANDPPRIARLDFRLDLEALSRVAIEAIGVRGDRPARETIEQRGLLFGRNGVPVWSDRETHHRGQIVGRTNDRRELVVAAANAQLVGLLHRFQEHIVERADGRNGRVDRLA